MHSSAELRKYMNMTAKIQHQLRFLDTELSQEEQDIKAACEASLYKFTEVAWFQIEGREFIPGWHMEVVALHLEALLRLDIRDLIINQPFRTGKSLLCSVIFPAWVWCTQPQMRFLYTSYSQRLSLRDSVTCRRLVMSPWFQRLWGRNVRLQPDAQNLQKFDNTRGGYRICTSMTGTATGFGGDFIIADDPNNVTQMESFTIKDKTNNAYDYTYSSRYTTLDDRRRLVMQQRADPGDLSGHILGKNDPSWVHLCLPMEYEPNRRCITIPLPGTKGKRWGDPRKREGELLWPAGVDATKLESLKHFDLNGDSYRISGQLQQRPSPAGGGIIRADWFNKWTDELPYFEYVIQSWDTAFTTKVTGATSAGTTWGVFKIKNVYNIMLISVFAGLLAYPDLRKMVIRMGNDYLDSYIDDPLPHDQRFERKPDLIVIEEKATGHILVHDLFLTSLPIIGFNPTKYGDKRARCGVISHIIENGLVWLPTEAPNYTRLTDEAQLFLDAATLFPKSRPGAPTNDIIDSMSQAFIRLKTTGWVYNQNDPQPPEDDEPLEGWN